MINLRAERERIEKETNDKIIVVIVFAFVFTIFGSIVIYNYPTKIIGEHQCEESAR